MVWDCPQHARFILVAMVGTSLALAGAACNAFLCYIFGLRLARRSQFLFFAALALFELNVDLSYIFVFPVRLLAEVTDNRRLFILWYSYLPFVYTWAHVSMTSASFMIVAASVDRCVQHFRRAQFTSRTRVSMIATAFFVALLIKGAMLVENRIIWNEECTGTWAEVTMDLAEFVYLNPWYFTGVMFWGRHICHVFLPFVILVLLHAAMLYSAVARARGSLARTLVLMAVQPTQTENAYESPVAARHSSARAARRMLCAVVTTYVSTHTLNVLITSWEFIDLHSIQSLTVYPFLTDTVSLLTVACSLSRLPMYYTLNRDVRAEVRPLFRGLWRSLLFMCSCGIKRKPSCRSRKASAPHEITMGNLHWHSTNDGAVILSQHNTELKAQTRLQQNGHAYMTNHESILGAADARGGDSLGTITANHWHERQPARVQSDEQQSHAELLSAPSGASAGGELSSELGPLDGTRCQSQTL